RLLGVEDGEGHVLHAVAVHRGLHRRRVRGRQRRGQDEADVALSQQVVRRIALAGGQVRDLLDLEAEAVRVEEGRLLRVAHVELHVVDVDELKGVARRGGGGGRLTGQSGHGRVLRVVVGNYRSRVRNPVPLGFWKVSEGR